MTNSRPLEALTPEDRKKLSGLLGFAQGVLEARSKVQMVMQTGMGVFHEGEVADLPGLKLDCDDGAWLRLRRQQETRPPEPPSHVAQFLLAKAVDPAKPPQIRPAISIDVSIEEASDLEEAGLLDSEDVHRIEVKGIVLENQVRVVLHANRCLEMQRDFERYSGGPWADWARQELPIRRAIAFYNDLFKIHSVIHTSEGTPPELVWGIGIGRWKVGAERIDMPLIEQLVDIEIEDGGAIAIRPRDLAPTVSLKPYLEIEVEGAAKLQRDLQDRFGQLLQGEVEFSPFTTIWEPILNAAASNLASDALYVDRTAFEGGETLEAVGDKLRITSTWALFGRPRSSEARVQDLEALQKRVSDESVEVPASIRGYASPPPDLPRAVSDFGLDSTILTGGIGQGWEPSATGAASYSVNGSSEKGLDGQGFSRKVHFFPLPFNEEQGRISDMIDDPNHHVVVVSGPPGTGKSHSIANIISHQMATGKRVLVTARTPEAIAAVREKLPAQLQPLVIASTGTDRESAQQLQNAVSELSNEVVSLDVEQALRRKSDLERRILDCDAIAEQADRDLSEIARANLVPLQWKGKEHTAMELVAILAEEEESHGWFTDRPEKLPPAQIDEVLERLKTALPDLAADILYAGATLPGPDDLPTTSELLSAHGSEKRWNSREVVNYTGAPVMALDGASAEAMARQTLAEIELIEETLARFDEGRRKFALRALSDKGGTNLSAFKSVMTVLAQQKSIDEIAKVRFELGTVSMDAFWQAAMRGATGQKPVGFGFFNGALKEAVGSVLVGGKAPSGAPDWQAVLDACQLLEARESISKALQPLVDAGLLRTLPDTPWRMAEQIAKLRKETGEAIELARRIEPVAESLRRLFPYGLDIDAMLASLDFTPASFAIRGNLPDEHVTPPAIERLREISGQSLLPVFSDIRTLADAIGNPDVTEQEIVVARSEITKELLRLSRVAPRIADLGRDLQAIVESGAPDWVSRLRNRPDAAPDLIPSTWRDAWAWAEMSARVDRIVALGNGDDKRRTKSDAMVQRRKLFKELIRTRTLLGLKQRMTGRIRQAMEAFTQAVSKIGSGKGKRAPRFIRAAQEAAKQASAAAPVWIMPEYKIPEQLPPEFGDFDLVILDEASQSDVTALAALARGKKILVVGDEEQVSPSVVGIPDQKINALRAQFLEGLPNSSLIDQNSSIFEISKRMHPDAHVMLREHFRCVAPIIQFSTRFYNNSLVPLRVPTASERFDPPLVDVYIPGATRQGKTNSFEARWIVDEIARLIDDPAHAGRSIGVISLIGNEQAEKIGRMLVEDERIGPEKIEQRRIIYGDARTMQGQERSIVFLSMVATPRNATSQTSKPDQQRMNVAMSRAQDRLYLVRSVTLEDLNPSDIKAQVLQHFANPMPEGRIATAKETEDLLERCESGFEREVLQRLIAANYRARPQVAAGGFRIDIVVEGAEDRRLAIELDGDQYHGPDVWDRDMARQAALERAGWVFWRVFGSQWRSDPDRWWRDLTATLERMQIAPIGAAALDERFTETIEVDFSLPGDERSAGTLSLVAPVEEAAPIRGLAERAAGSEVAVRSRPEGAAQPVAPTSPRNMTNRPVLQVKRADGAQGSFQLEDDLFSRRRPAVDEEIGKAGSAEIVISHAPAAEPKGAVRVGSTVRIEKLNDGGGKIEITVVETGHDPDLGMIGVHTPLGQALLDAEVGDEVEYHSGPYLREVRVLSIS